MDSSSAEGAFLVEAPKAPREVECWEGMSPPIIVLINILLDHSVIVCLE